MAMTPEGKVKKAIRKVLDAAGVWYYMPVQTGMGKGGIPDFICCQPVVVTPDMVGSRVGLFVGIEAKRLGNLAGTTELQKDQIEAIQSAGGIAGVADRPELAAALLRREA